jgi:hypothetical protein
MATITSAQVGTAVASGTGTFSALSVTMPPAANADLSTQMVLLDATPATLAAGKPAPILYAARFSDLLAFIYGWKPNSIPGVPGAPTRQAVGTLMTAGAIAFKNGLYVLSCPANVTFTSTP